MRVTSTQTCLIIIILGDFEFSKMFEESRLRYLRRLVGEGFEGGEGSRGSCLLVFQFSARHEVERSTTRCLAPARLEP